MTFSPSQCQRGPAPFRVRSPCSSAAPSGPRAAPPLVRFSCLTAINRPRHTLQPQLIVRGATVGSAEAAGTRGSRGVRPGDAEALALTVRGAR